MKWLIGKTISKSMAKKWVTSMKPYGEHWDYETTTQLLKDNGINLEPIDFYVVINMMYNDYAKVIGDDLDMYVKLSRAWLKDEDAKEGKLYEYWKTIVKH